MTAIIMKHFDILEFVNKAKENGITSEFAEYTARQIEQLSETIEEQRVELDVLKAKEPAMKGDIRESELRLQKEIEVIRKEIEVLKKDTLHFVVYKVCCCLHLFNRRDVRNDSVVTAGLAHIKNILLIMRN